MKESNCVKIYGYKTAQELLPTCFERDRHFLAPATKEKSYEHAEFSCTNMVS